MSHQEMMHRKFYIPNFIYEALPVAYILFGSGAAVLGSTGFTRLCGLILVMAGFHIHALRKAARHKMHQRRQQVWKHGEAR